MTNTDNISRGDNSGSLNPPTEGADGAGEKPGDGNAAKSQRDALLQSERNANVQQPRNFKDDALTEKVVHVDHEGTGPSPIDTLDPPKS